LESESELKLGKPVTAPWLKSSPELETVNT